MKIKSSVFHLEISTAFKLSFSNICFPSDKDTHYLQGDIQATGEQDNSKPARPITFCYIYKIISNKKTKYLHNKNNMYIFAAVKITFCSQY